MNIRNRWQEEWDSNPQNIVRFWRALFSQLNYLPILEWMTGIEPATSSLATKCSTN